MRVAHFVQRYPPALGGSEAYLQRLSRYQIAHGDRVTVWTTTAFDLEAFWSPRGRTLSAGETDESGVTVRRFPLWRMRGRRWLLKPLSLIPQRTWQALTIPCSPISFAMRRAVERNRERYDIVHATAFPYAWPIVCARRLARRLDVPFALTPFLHLGDPTNPNDRTRRQYASPALCSLLRSADIVFAQTPGEVDQVRAIGVPSDRIVLQGLGVDPDECTCGDRNAVRSRWGVDDDEVVVGHLANSSVEKGTTDLLLAAERLWQRGVAFRVVLAGPEMPNFRRFFAQYSRADRVIRLGMLSEHEKRDFFAGLDVFALPSRSDSFGLVLLEAWANGLPNVVYRAGGPGDLVRHESDGLQARCGDIEELADQLGRLIQNASMRRALGDEGRRRVEWEFQWEEKLDTVCTRFQRATAAQQGQQFATAAPK